MAVLWKAKFYVHARTLTDPPRACSVEAVAATPFDVSTDASFALSSRRFVMDSLMFPIAFSIYEIKIYGIQQTYIHEILLEVGFNVLHCPLN